MAFLSWGRRSGSRKTSSSKFRTFIFSSLLSSKSCKIKWLFFNFNFEVFGSMMCDNVPCDKFSRGYVWWIKCVDPRHAPRDSDLTGFRWEPVIGVSDRLSREWEFLKEICAFLSLEHYAFSPLLFVFVFQVQEVIYSFSEAFFGWHFFVLHSALYHNLPHCKGWFNYLDHWTMSKINNWGIAIAKKKKKSCKENLSFGQWLECRTSV